METLEGHDGLIPKARLFCAVTYKDKVLIADAEIDKASKDRVWLKTMNGPSSDAFGWRRVLLKDQLEKDCIGRSPQEALELAAAKLTKEVTAARKVLKKIVIARNRIRAML